MEPAIGIITMFAANFAPRRWAFCAGQLLPINQNTALFSILGTTYGGNGQTTFALPDLRGRTPIHSGNSQGPGLSFYGLGQRAGTETTTLTLQNLPAHTHQASFSFGVSSATANADEPAGNVPALTTVNAYRQGASPSGQLGSTTVVVNPAGGNQPISIRQPYLAINFIICMQGIFPSRN